MVTKLRLNCPAPWATQRLAFGPSSLRSRSVLWTVFSAPSGNWLEMQNLSPAGPAEPESTFQLPARQLRPVFTGMFEKL